VSTRQHGPRGLRVRALLDYSREVPPLAGALETERPGFRGRGAILARMERQIRDTTEGEETE